MIRFSSFRLSPLRIIRARPLRRFAPRLLDRRLWQVTPHAIGLGVAIGLFFGFLFPVGQLFLAVLTAVFLRGNLLVSAMSTLVTNPLTFPPIYYAAWQVGGVMRDWLPQAVTAEATHLAAEAHLLAEDMAGGLGAASGELILGLLTFACLSVPLGYFLGWGGTLLAQRLRKGSTKAD